MCVSSSWFSIVINGSPKEFFPAKRGLRQGDRSSFPFLFVIVGEAFSRILSMAGAANLIQGVNLARNYPTISHLQFIDDTLIFCDANEDQVKNVKVIFLCYAAVSGLKVNYWEQR